MLQAAPTLPGSTIPVGAFVGAMSVLAGFYGLIVTVLHKLSRRWGAFVAPAIAIGGLAAVLGTDPTAPAALGRIEPRWLLGVAALALLAPMITAPLGVMILAKRRGHLSFALTWIAAGISFLIGLALGVLVAGLIITIAALFYRGIVA